MNAPKALLVACAIMANAGTGIASTGTSTGSGALPGFSGYGFEYVATWTATEGSFVFGHTISYFPGPDGGIVFFNGGFGPASGSYPYIEVLDFSGTLTYSIVNLNTGLPELPAQMNTAAYTDRTVLGSTPGTLPVALRFSNSQITNSSTITDANGLPLGTAPQLTPTVTITMEYQFLAGHFAMVSSDPSCATVACMPVGYDQLTGETRFRFVTSVPEPASAGLMLGGGALLALAALSRRHSGRGRSTAAL